MLHKKMSLKVSATVDTPHNPSSLLKPQISTNPLGANDSATLSKKNIRQQRRSMGTKLLMRSGLWSSKDYSFSSMNTPMCFPESPWPG